MNGSNVVVAELLLMVPDGVFVPHQLFVAVIVVWSLFRFLPTPEDKNVFPARRLNEMVVPPPPELLPAAIPAPETWALLLVTVILLSPTVSGDATPMRIPPPQPRPFPPVASLLSISVSAPITVFAEVQTPPPSTCAMFPVI